MTTAAPAMPHLTVQPSVPTPAAPYIGAAVSPSYEAAVPTLKFPLTPAAPAAAPVAAPATTAAAVAHAPVAAPVAVPKVPTCNPYVDNA